MLRDNALGQKPSLTVDEYILIDGWDDKTTSHLALGKLRGPAEIWYRGLLPKLFTWVDWRNMMISKIGPHPQVKSPD
jgi:hypothetical protein